MGIASAITRGAIITAFDLSAALAYRVTVIGLRHLPRAQRVYVAMQHKRDTDPIVIVPEIITRLGWSALAGDLRFSMRGDAFAPGFLAHLVRRPPWLARALYPLQLGPFLRGLGLYPLVHARQHAFDEWLWLAARIAPRARIGAALRPEWISQIAKQAGVSPDRIAHLPLKRARHWRYLPLPPVAIEPEMFAPDFRPRVAHEAVARLKGALANIATWLDAGGSLLGSPEAGLSPDGHIAPISAGFHRILRACDQPITVAPIAITYDYLTPGRPRVFVACGPAIAQANHMPPADLDARLHAAWRGGGVITATQLGAAFLLDCAASPAPRFTEAAALASITAQARRFHQLGAYVDPALLEARRARRRIHRLLAQAQRQGIIYPFDANQWEIAPQPDHMDLAPEELGFARYPLLYARNELADIISALPPATGAGPQEFNHE